MWEEKKETFESKKSGAPAGGAFQNHPNDSDESNRSCDGSHLTQTSWLVHATDSFQFSFWPRRRGSVAAGMKLRSLNFGSAGS